MKKTLDLNDYYLGVIVATPEYLNNPKKNRYLGEVNFDPFGDIDPFSAVTFGMITLLKKEIKDGQERYVDQYYSRYRNELSYTLHDRNKLGIVLAHVKPFCELYHDRPKWYMEEEFIRRCEEDENFYFNHTYYIAVKDTGDEALIILDEAPSENVQIEYFRNLLGEDEFHDICQIYDSVVAKPFSMMEGKDDSLRQYHQLISNYDLSLGKFIQMEWMRRQFVASYSQNAESKKEYVKRSETNEN